MLKRELLLPCPTTLRRRLDLYYESVKKEIKQRVPKGTKIALAIDTWTSPNHLAFMAIMGFFISPMWELKEVMLGFDQLPDAHTGKEQAEVVLACLQRFNLEHRLGAIMSDNATVNESVNAELAKLLDSQGMKWDPIQNKIGCLAHTVQLILGVFIDSLRLKATNETVPTSLKRGKIAKVVDMSPGFKKIIAKVCDVLRVRIVDIIVDMTLNVGEANGHRCFGEPSAVQLFPEAAGGQGGNGAWDDPRCQHAVELHPAHARSSAGTQGLYSSLGGEVSSLSRPFADSQ